MKLLLILVGFFACMSVERVGFRKWSFIFRPGILFLVAIVALVCAGCYRDDSDAPTGSRSNMTPLTDNLTGCQYMAYGFSGITPRMGGGRRKANLPEEDAMSRAPVWRALEAARVSHSIQREPKYDANAGPPLGDYPMDRTINKLPLPQYTLEQQAVVIRHMPTRQRDPDAMMLHEQEIADLRATVRHMNRRGYEQV